MTKKKKYNTNLIKETLSYSVKDISLLYGIHKRTVQQWIKEGLAKIDSRKPILILGYNLKEHIKLRQEKRKRKCKPSELYCCKCRAPRSSWNNLVDIKVLNEKNMLIQGICSQCDTQINRLARVQNILKVMEIFEVQTIHNKDLIGFNTPIVNTDIKEVTLK